MNKARDASQKMASGMNKTAKGSSMWVKAFDKVVGVLSKVERKLDAVFRAGVHMQSMGRDLLGFAQGAAGAAADAVSAWGDFEFTLNRAAAAADIFDTQSELYDQLKNSVYDLSHELRIFPAEEVAKGLYFWQSTTGEVIDSQEDLIQTMESVESVMKVAAMTDTSYEQAIKGVYSTLKQFNMTTADTAEVSELLFYATQKTALEFPDLIHSLKMTGAVAGQASEPLETMVAILGAVGNAGIRGSQAGRALRQTYIKIVKPTAKAKGVLDELFKAQGGYNKVAFDAQGNFIGMEKYVMKLGAAMKGLNYQQRANILATITTANELPVMTQMVGAATRAVNEGKDTWVEYFATQEEAHKAFEGTWSNFENSWKGALGGLKQSFMPIVLEVGRSIAEVLTPALNELNVVIWDNVPAVNGMASEIIESFRPIVEQVTAVIKSMIAWAAANPKIVKQLAKFGIIAAVIAGVAGAILLAAGTFVFMLSNILLITIGMAPMIAVFTMAGIVIAAAAKHIYDRWWAVSKVLRFFADAAKRFFTILIFGSEDTEGGLRSLADTINTIVGRAVEKLVRIIADLAIWMNSVSAEDIAKIKQIGLALAGIVASSYGLGIVLGKIKEVTTAYRTLYETTKTGIKITATAADSAKSGAGKVMDVIGGVITGLIVVATKVGPMLMGTVGLFLGVIGVIAAVIAVLVAAYLTNFMGFKDFVDGVVNWIMTNVVPPLLFVLGEIGNFIRDVVLPAIGEFINWLVSTFGPVLEQAGKTAEAFGAFLGTLIGAFMEPFEVLAEAFSQFWQWLDSVLEGIGVDISEFSITVESIFQFLSDAVNNIVLPWLENMAEFWGGILEGIAGVVQGFFEILEGIFQVFTGILNGDWQLMWDGIENIISGFAQVAESIVRGFIGIFVGLWNGMIEIVSGIFKTFFGTGEGSVYMQIAGFINTLQKFGEDVINGFVEGIGGAIGGAIDSVVKFFSNIIEGIKYFLGVRSPSTLMAGIGDNIVSGLWKGINDAKNWIIGKITAFIKNIIPEPIRNILGISSPSKVMAGLGENIVQGLAQGIVNTDDALVAMNALSNNLASVVDSTQGQVTVAAEGGQFSLNKTYDKTMRIDLNVNVESGDGSLDQISLNKLASIISGSDMVNALERMSTVD